MRARIDLPVREGFYGDFCGRDILQIIATHAAGVVERFKLGEA